MTTAELIRRKSAYAVKQAKGGNAAAAIWAQREVDILKSQVLEIEQVRREIKYLTDRIIELNKTYNQSKSETELYQSIIYQQFQRCT